MALQAADKASAPEELAGDNGRLSILDHLKERREEIKQEATIDLRVERWDKPYIWVRYKPVDHSIIRAANTQVEAAPPKKKGEVEVNVNADVLIRGCVGVFAKVNEDDEEEFSLRSGDWHGTLTKFDKDLAANLGLPEGATARDIVKSLYIFEGEILSTAVTLSVFSGYKEKEADERIQGES